MIKTLVLTNFGKHESLTVDFTAGLNVIRAANEGGKSTLYKAIAYALWGSRALPDPLDDTVTWGVPVSKLSVKLQFFVAGVEYEVVRSKSGATLTGAGSVSSGQAEVTAKVEELLGASASIGAATLLAGQGKLAVGADSSAIALIERLSNMSLLDELVGRMKDGLPSGSTKIVEATIASYGEVVEPVPTVDYSTYKELSEQLEAAKAVKSDLASRLSVVSPTADEARKREAQQVAAKSRVADLQRLADKPLPAEPVEPKNEYTYEQLLTLATEAEDSAKRLAMYKKYVALANQPGPSPIADRDTVLATTLAMNNRVTELVAEHITVQSDLAVTKALVIQESHCGLCGKDLQDIPEVASKNKAAELKIAALSATRDSLVNTIMQLKENLKSCANLEAYDTNLGVTSRTLAQYVTEDLSTIPRKLLWIGAIPEEISSVDYKGLLAKHKKSTDTYLQGKAAYEAAVAYRKKIVLEMESITTDYVLPGDADTLKEFATLTVAVRTEEQKVAKLAEAKANEQRRQAVAEAQDKAAAGEYTRKVAARAEAVKLLADCNRNNALIRKLQDARPVVANRLWATLMDGISTIFSEIRGVQSKVSRTSDGLLIDGKASRLYSGSTQDALGLAVRFMLQKTFLPNAGFVMLDEPAAGADEVRETDMIASVIRADFAQVIMVTHSALADTYASNLITLG